MCKNLENTVNKLCQKIKDIDVKKVSITDVIDIINEHGKSFDSRFYIIGFQILNNTEQQRVQFNSITVNTYDNLNEFNTTTFIFTPQDTGFYHIDINIDYTVVLPATDDTILILQFFDNTTTSIVKFVRSSTQFLPMPVTNENDGHISFSFDAELFSGHNYTVIFLDPVDINASSLNIFPFLNIHRFF